MSFANEFHTNNSSRTIQELLQDGAHADTFTSMFSLALQAGYNVSVQLVISFAFGWRVHLEALEPRCGDDSLRNYSVCWKARLKCCCLITPKIMVLTRCTHPSDVSLSMGHGHSSSMCQSHIECWTYQVMTLGHDGRQPTTGRGARIDRRP